MLIFLSSCKNHIQSQKKSNLYQTIVKAFIEDRNSDTKIDPQENILIIGANTSENIDNAYWVDMAFVNPKLLQNFEYKKVYMIDGYKLIIDESLNKSNKLNNSFIETKYENFNLAIVLIEYSLKNWHITFNSNNEIIRISPKNKSKEIKDLLIKKGVKFSKDFDDLE